MDSQRLLRLIRRKTGKNLGKIAILPLPGQVPGEYIAEHNQRIKQVIVLFWDLYSAGHDVTIICASGTADADGLTGARYMRNQIITFSGANSEKIAKHIVIGEETSGHSAATIISSRQFIMNGGYDLVILVSNWPHLLPAGAYFKHLIPEVPFIKGSSGAGIGCLNQSYWKYLLREIVHYAAAMTFDRWPFHGHFLDKQGEKLTLESRQKRFPPIQPFF